MMVVDDKIGGMVVRVVDTVIEMVGAMVSDVIAHIELLFLLI